MSATAKSQMFFSLFRNPHPRNSHLGCWHLFNSEKCQDRGFFKPSWIIPFFLGQVIPGHSPAVSKKGKQDTRWSLTEGVCSSSASILKRLTGMLVWLPLDWEFPLPLLGLGSGPDEEVAVLVTAGGVQTSGWWALFTPNITQCTRNSCRKGSPPTGEGLILPVGKIQEEN